MTRLVLALVVAALLPMRAAADPRFELPPVTAVSASAGSHEVVLVDEKTGRRARVAVGDRCAGSYRVVDINRERVVLRRVGAERVYYVLPIRADSPAATGDAPDLAPIEPYSDPKVRRVLAPASARASEPQESADSSPSSGPAEPGGAAEPPRPAARPELEDLFAEPQRTTDSTSPAPRSALRDPATATTARPMPASREISLSRIDAALADLAALARQVSVRTERGGVRITSLESGSLAHDLGLRQGDLVRRVAGRRVDSAGAAAALYAHLARVEEVSVELERDGDELVLRYRLVP